MEKYHKIQTIFKRDPNTNFKTLLEGEYSLPVFEYLKDNKWVFTEKIDGTNIRVIHYGNYGEGNVYFEGKTDNAQIPPFLLDKLKTMFPDDVLQDVFGEADVCLYGEGYGAKIQKGGGNYIPNGVDFILFDVKINDIWLKRQDIEEIAQKLEIGVTPVVGAGTLQDAIEIVKKGFKSKIGNCIAEGLVLRPENELYDRMGRRIITKIKYKDFTK